MKHLFLALFLVLALALLAGAAPAEASPPSAACWGQASAVYAQTGEMGAHASAQGSPRAGLRNLARSLYAAGIIPDDSMAALGQFVVAELGLTVEACAE